MTTDGYKEASRIARLVRVWVALRHRRRRYFNAVFGAASARSIPPGYVKQWSITDSQLIGTATPGGADPDEWLAVCDVMFLSGRRAAR